MAPHVGTRSRLLDRALDGRPPTPEESAELARRWQGREDAEARNALVVGHLRIAALYALRYRRYGVPASDLFAEASLGLLRATDKFDPDRGARFATYAEYWVRSRVLRCMQRSWSVVRGSSRDQSLDAPCRPEGTSLLDHLEHGAPTAEDVAGVREHRDLVRQVVGDLWSGLDGRQRAVVEERLMRGRGERTTLAEIGRRFGITRQRVRQIEVDLVDDLRGALAARLGAG